MSWDTPYSVMMDVSSPSVVVVSNRASESVGLFDYSFRGQTEKGMAFGKEQLTNPPSCSCLNLASVLSTRDLGS